MEFTFHCTLCDHRESWDTERAAEAAAVWHVYEDHFDTWEQMAGRRSPVDPRPELLGRRFEDWESQA